ncbi:MAG: ferritin [Spirochaetales bacterium]
MISKKMEEALNLQINKEMYSAYLYMGMAAQCTEKGFNGFAKWFMVQYHEEMFHAMKIYNYIHDQGGTVKLQTIEGPKEQYASLKAMFEKTLEHEKTVTASIKSLVDLAKKEDDPATEIFLQWYVTEQVEEEKNAMDILQQFQILGREEGPGIFQFDAALKGRQLSVPSDFSAMEGA